MSGQYARSTQVGTERSRSEIEHLVRRFGASGFAYAWTEDAATIAFHVGNLTIRIALPLPRPDDPVFWLTPTKPGRAPWAPATSTPAPNARPLPLLPAPRALPPA